MKSLTCKFLLAAALACLFAAAAIANDESIKVKLPALVTEHITVPSDTPGIQLYVRNKRPKELAVSADRILLYVHGATYPSETAFDLQLDGMSWMDYIAAHGWDVYLVDLRGYGLSTRPAEMDRPPQENAPIVTTDVAVRDVGNRGRVHPQASRCGKNQSAGLVMGHVDHGRLRGSQQRQGEKTGAVRAALAAQHAEPAWRRRPARRLPHRAERECQEALARRAYRKTKRRT